MATIHTYVEKTYNWCDDCVAREMTQKFISDYNLYELKIHPFYKCGGCGRTREEIEKQ